MPDTEYRVDQIEAQLAGISHWQIRATERLEALERRVKDLEERQADDDLNASKLAALARDLEWAGLTSGRVTPSTAARDLPARVTANADQLVALRGDLEALRTKVSNLELDHDMMHPHR